MIKNQTFLDKYSNLDILSMSEMTRYSGRLKITKESVAEHSWYVAYFILLVGNDYKIDNNIINKAVSMSIIHDIPEIFTNDIPHDMKENFPELKKKIEEVEIEFVKDKIPELYYLFSDLKNKSIESILVSIGDALSVLLYTNKEINLGNKTKEITIISNEVKVRLTKLFIELERMINNNEILGN